MTALAPDPTPSAAQRKPKLVLGWVIAADLRDPEVLSAYDRAKALLGAHLERQFPMFDWQMPRVERRSFPPRGALDPLELLELGAEEKLHRRWDFALVVVPNDLQPRRRLSTLGVSSSALEVMVLSSARLGSLAVLPERLAALALHLFGQLLGLDVREEGPMRPVEAELLRLEPFPPDQADVVAELLHDVADTRLEETQRRWNGFAFYLRAFINDWWGIIKSILGYRPWRIPLYLRRLTAAVAASLLVLLLTAESWEAGTHMPAQLLVGTTLVSIGLATAFIFYGQRLELVRRGRGWSEQLARSRLVLLGTLLSGMVSLWAFIFALVLVASYLLPAEVVSAWTGFAPSELPRLNFVAFMASLGILAAALGGNLEEENAIKAELLIDEEV